MAGGYGPTHQQLIDATGAPFGTSTNPISVNLVDTNTYNVKYYGAKGDGTTNDTAAIKSAITAIPAAGGILFFPPGNYKISDVLTLAPETTVQGSGDPASTITQSTTNKDIFAAVDPYNMVISSIKLVGTGSGTGMGIHFFLSVNTNMMLITLERVTVASCGGDGIHLENAIVSQLNRVNASACAGYGFNIIGTGTGTIGTSTTLTSCYADTCTGAAGFRLYSMCYTSLVSCASDSNTLGYLIDTCQAVALVGCGSESCITAAYKISGGYGVSMTSCWVYDEHGVGIWITGSATAVVLSSVAENSPHAGATAFIKVDTASAATIISYSNVTANNFAVGTVTIINDGGGNMTIAETLNLTNGATITFGTTGDSDLYRLGVNSLATDSKLTVYGDFSAQGKFGAFAATPVAKPVVTGSKGANAALTSLMTALAALGLVVNSTT